MEFDKYRRLGAYHWREYERQSIYRAYVDELLPWIEGDRVLDVGAGDGLICHKLGAVGVELDPLAVELANKRGANVFSGDAGALPFDPESFDAVLMGDVIEHLEDPAPALRDAYLVLVTNGRLYVTTPPKRTPIRKYHYREYTSVTLLDQVEPFGFSAAGTPFTRHERIHAVFRKR